MEQTLTPVFMTGPNCGDDEFDDDLLVAHLLTPVFMTGPNCGEREYDRALERLMLTPVFMTGPNCGMVYAFAAAGISVPLTPVFMTGPNCGQFDRRWSSRRGSCPDAGLHDRPQLRPDLRHQVVEGAVR